MTILMCPLHAGSSVRLLLLLLLLTSLAPLASLAPSHEQGGFAADSTAEITLFDALMLYFETNYAQLDSKLTKIESLKPNEIQQLCPAIEAVDANPKLQKQREQLMTFLNKDAYRVIEAYSKVADKIIDTCGQKEENKISIEIMRTVQSNFMEPILSNTWPGWMYLAIVFIVLFILSLGFIAALAFIHFDSRTEWFIRRKQENGRPNLQNICRNGAI